MLIAMAMLHNVFSFFFGFIYTQYNSLLVMYSSMNFDEHIPSWIHHHNQDAGSSISSPNSLGLPLWRQPLFPTPNAWQPFL